MSILKERFFDSGRQTEALAGPARIRFDDHPNAKRFSDRIETVTVDSVLDWLARTGQGTPAQRIAL